jgi:Double zinc ribbon
MNCPDCETYNDSNRRYCLQCGKFLILSCNRCSFSNPLRARYCGGCGDRLEASGALTGIDREARGSRSIDSQQQNFVVSPGELDELLGDSTASADAELPNKLSQQDLDRLFGNSK